MRLPFNQRNGSATVEFAVIAPILALLMLGTVEVTRAIQVKNLLTDTARSGCRYGAQPGMNTQNITDNITSVLADDGINAAEATVTVMVNDVVANASTANRGDKLTVKIAVPIARINWVTPFFFPSTAVESESLHMPRQ